MIQDIFPRIYSNHYSERTPVRGDSVLVFNGKSLYARREAGELVYPQWEQRDWSGMELVYLFSIDEESYFMTESDDMPGEGWELLGTQDFRQARPKALAFAGVVACQLHMWYNDNRFCGRCGHPTERDHAERMLRCPECGAVVYPKICPAVIVAVTDGDRVLLTKYRGRQAGDWALVAGFNEIGESIEDTVRREVMEEAGLRVRDITFYKSQPWPFTGTLLFGFFCRVDGGRDIVMDEGELSVAEWVERGSIGLADNDLSLTREMICVFENGMEHIVGDK